MDSTEGLAVVGSALAGAVVVVVVVGPAVDGSVYSKQVTGPYKLKEILIIDN